MPSVYPTQLDPLKRYALRFISGKYQGGELPLDPGKEVVVGRSSELDIVLVEDMVSRRHTRILYDGSQVTVEDLGSTNGTYVNGERVQRAQISVGDRILIGSNILKLVEAEPEPSGAQVYYSEPPHAHAGGHAAGSNAVSIPAPPQPFHTVQGTVQGRTSMAGSIEDVPLPDLLQLFSTSRKSGTILLHSTDGLAKLHLRDGRVVFAVINDNDTVDPLKVAFRVLRWERGTFEFTPPEDRSFPRTIQENTEFLLMEAMRLLDELRQIEGKLPAMNSMLVIPRPLEPPLRELPPEQLDMLQHVHNYGSFQALLDGLPTSDLDISLGLLPLLERGYVKAY